MNMFISSLITGMEPYRAAAKEAVDDLGHCAIMAENFEASPHSPQIACMNGVRQAAIVILLLGENYGSVQQAYGISATHEEYREAKQTKPVIAFVQENINPEPEQHEFIKEVQGWSAGLFRGSFTTPTDLKRKITRAVHEWELASAVAPVDTQALIAAVNSLMPEQQRRYSGGYERGLVFAVSSGPEQAILRPSALEAIDFHNELLQTALFGPYQVFDSKYGSEFSIENDALVLRQQDDRAEIIVNSTGAIKLKLLFPKKSHDSALPVIIQEDVQQLLTAALAYTNWLLNKIDPTNRLSQHALACTLIGADHAGWRTQRENDTKPSSMTMRMLSDSPKPVMLTPPIRSRSALHFDAEKIIEDMVTLLRRSWRTE